MMNMQIKPLDTPQLWGDKRYHTWNYHLRQTFQEKVFKVPLDGGSVVRTGMAASQREAARFAVPGDRETLPGTDGWIWKDSSMT